MESTPLFSALLSFLFVIGLLLATLWFVKLGGVSGQSIRVLNVQRLSSKHQLQVVEYDGKRLLLGIGPSQITLLDTQSLADEGVATATTLEDKAGGSSAFASVLDKELKTSD
jgi:flagellar biogenesis protein FliO